MNASDLSLIVKTYNEPASLQRVLEGLLTGSVLPGEILVADDGSGPETRAFIETISAQHSTPIVHLWHEDRGFRPAPILNRAIAAANGAYVIFMDGDCVPTRRFVEDHARLAEDGFLVQGRRVFVNEAAVPTFLRGDAGFFKLALQGRARGLFKAVRLPRPRIQRDTDLYGVLGCNLAVWRKDLRAINGFDEAYEGWGREDSDLVQRLYHLGRRRKFVHGRALVFHLNHPPRTRDRLRNNDALLEDARARRRVRCERGLDQYLSPTADERG
ncbi:MAG: glycosyltransferase family 2 protein [Opitutales bacterium]